MAQSLALLSLVLVMAFAAFSRSVTARRIRWILGFLAGAALPAIALVGLVMPLELISLWEPLDENSIPPSCWAFVVGGLFGLAFQVFRHWNLLRRE